MKRLLAGLALLTLAGDACGDADDGSSLGDLPPAQWRLPAILRS